jgi:acyl-CoA synthetase (AMP-forming)/AMP-acid ligase II
VTLDVRYRERELDHMLNQSGARIAVSAAAVGESDLAAFYAGFRGRIPQVETVLFLGGGAAGDRRADLPTDPDDEALAAAEAEVRPEDPAVILSTPGAPKGAILTHASVLGAAGAQVGHMGTGPTDTLVGVLPLNHVGGVTCRLTASLLAGATLVLPPAFSPAGALADIAAHRATMFAGVPTMWTLLLGHPAFAEHDMSAVRTAVIGGSNADPVLCAAIGNVLAAHPAVSIAAGIGVPDPVLGEVGRFYVVPRPGSTPTAQGLLAHCAERVADDKVPRQIVFADELPVTPAGKIAKAELRGRYDREK